MKIGTKIFISTLIAYIVVSIYDFSIVWSACTNFAIMLTRVIPILGIVFLIMIVTNLYLTPQMTQKYLGQKSGIKGWAYATIAGIIMSGPPYVFYPLLGELKQKGMTYTLLAVFLFNRNVKIPFFPVMIYYFGIPFTIILSLYIIIFSIFNGMIIGILVPTKKDLAS